jgi:hypothetical protein
MQTWVEQQRQKKAKIGDNIATAITTIIPVPQFVFAEPVGILWCAYVSPSYLKYHQLKDSIYVPFSTGMKNGRDADTCDFLKYPATWRLFKNQDYIEELDFYNSRNIQFTNAIYETLQVTNSGGKTIPSFATATLFVYDSSGVRKSAGLELQLSTEKNIPLDSVIFHPVIPGRTIITDERFNSIGGNLHFMYSVNSNWLSIEQAKSSKGYKEAALVFPPTQDKPKVSSFVKVLFLLLSAAPIIYVLKLKRFRS